VARSVWVTPLNSHVKKENVRKLFYDAHCGVVLNVTIQDHKVKVNPAKARYAFGFFLPSLFLAVSACPVYLAPPCS